MSQRIILYIFILQIWACSTAPKSTENLSAKTDKATKVAKIDESKKAESSNSVPLIPKVTTFISSVFSSKGDPRYDALNKAVSEGDLAKIKTTSIDLLRINSKDFVALNALGMYHYRNKQYDAAILLLNKALALKADSSVIYNNIGLVEYAKNNHRNALMMFRKALELDPKNTQAAANAASIYVQNKDYLKAVYSFEKAASSEKNSLDSLNNYAIALSAIGKEKESAEVYEKILKLKSDHKFAMLNYAIFLIEKKSKFKEGLDLINRLKFVGVDDEAQQVIKKLEIKAKAGLK